MENLAIEVDGLTKTFRLNKNRFFSKKLKNSKDTQNILRVLDRVSFSVSKGEVFGIIGSNGSGKTTLLRTICGIYKPDSGTTKTHGKLAPLLQIGVGFQGDLNAKDNIIMNGMLLNIPKSEIEKKVDDIMKYSGLEKFSQTKLKHYSSGMRSRLAFAVALKVDPDIILVDEILSVGDRNAKKKSLEEFLKFKNAGKTIILTSHSIGMISKICDRVLLLDHGKIVMIGKPVEVVEKYKELSLKKSDSL